MGTDAPDLVENQERPGWLQMSEEMFEVAEGMTNDHGWPMIYTEWRTESVFLTREEGERYAKARSYRWPKWRVYCIPCDGELAVLLSEYQKKAEAVV
ncbi:MAG: hypothetical protein IPL86_19245 [Flavobacteriales bacterium]|nr:hypothetical protein [Flavobacteriales bacterium]